MKYKRILALITLLLSFSAVSAHAAVLNDLVASTAAVSQPFQGGTTHHGSIDVVPLVPVTIVDGYGSGSALFFDTGDGTGDAISLFSVSGLFPQFTTRYMADSSMTLGLEGGGNTSPVPLPSALLFAGSGFFTLAALRNRSRLMIGR